MDINTQVLETKYVLNFGQLLRIIHDIKRYILKLVCVFQPMTTKPIIYELTMILLFNDHQNSYHPSSS